MCFDRTTKIAVVFKKSEIAVVFKKERLFSNTHGMLLLI